MGYAEKVLGITTLTPDQQTILRSLLDPPCRVLVPSAHDTGKTFVAAVAISWWYDSFDPGAIFTIGPRHDSLKDTIWGEVRRQRARAGLPDEFIGPSAPEIRSSTDHWGKAFTASKDASLTGRHLPRMLFVIEEACAVDPIWWEVIMTMFDPSLDHAMLAIFNPTDTTSQAYIEDQNASDPDGDPRWHRYRLSALNHPNILAELKGDPKPIPGAVSKAMIDDAVRDLCEPVEVADLYEGDFQWPPGSGHWFRPGAVFQARWLGVWPKTGSGVWSDALWEACVNGDVPPFPLRELPCLGADMATGKGEDFFAVHGRWGAVSLLHVTANTMDPVRIYGSIKDAAAQMAAKANAHRDRNAEPIKPQQIPINIDDDGTGNAVGAFLRADGYTCHLVGAGCRSTQPDLYPLMRSELWFRTAEKAKVGGVYFGLLDRQTRRRLKQQLMAVEWKLDGAGKRAVERKDDTKEKIGRSPDDGDAVNLSHHSAPSMVPVVHEPPERTDHGGHFGRGRR